MLRDRCIMTLPLITSLQYCPVEDSVSASPGAAAGGRSGDLRDGDGTGAGAIIGRNEDGKSLGPRTGGPLSHQVNTPSVFRRAENPPVFGTRHRRPGPPQPGDRRDAWGHTPSPSANATRASLGHVGGDDDAGPPADRDKTRLSTSMTPLPRAAQREEVRTGPQVHHAAGHRGCGIARFTERDPVADLEHVSSPQHDDLAILRHVVQIAIDTDGRRIKISLDPLSPDCLTGGHT